MHSIVVFGPDGAGECGSTTCAGRSSALDLTGRSSWRAAPSRRAAARRLDARGRCARGAAQRGRTYHDELAAAREAEGLDAGSALPVAADDDGGAVDLSDGVELQLPGLEGGGLISFKGIGGKKPEESTLTAGRRRVLGAGPVREGRRRLRRGQAGG
jgi:hypothetical protein